jgi:hypothetical protein
MKLTNETVEYFANIIVKLYSNQRIKNFVPTLNKKRIQYDDVVNANVLDDYTKIEGCEKISDILKRTLLLNIDDEVELLENGILRNNLKKTIDLMEPLIVNLKMSNSQELEKKEKELKIIKEKYNECLQKGEFEEITEYKKIATETLKIMKIATEDFYKRKQINSYELTETELLISKLKYLICQKFGIKQDTRPHWMKKKETSNYEYKKQDKDNYFDYSQNDWKQKFEKKQEKPVEFPELCENNKMPEKNLGIWSKINIQQKKNDIWSKE